MFTRPFAISCIGLFGIGTIAAQPKFEEILRQNSAHAAALETLIVVERVTHQRHVGNQEQGERDDLLRERCLAARDSVLEGERARGTTASELSGLEATWADRCGRLEMSLRVVNRLNDKWEIRREAQIDLRGQRARYDDEDLRPIAALAAEHGLDVGHQIDLSKSGTLIVDSHARLWWPALKASLPVGAVRTDGQCFSLGEQLLKLGILPREVVDEADSYHLAPLETVGPKCYLLTGTKNGVPVFLAAVDEALEWRLRTLVRFHPNGGVREEWNISDYRREHDVWTPYSVDKRRTVGLAYSWTENYRVESVVLNAALDDPDNLFRLPAHVTVVDMTWGGTNQEAAPAENSEK